MEFTFDEDQTLFAETVRDILANECPPAAVRDAWANATGAVPGLWETLASTGVIGMTAPEADAGLGMSELDLVMIMEELGRAACPEPVLEHTAVAIPLLEDAGSQPQRDEWLAASALGGRRLTVSLGSRYVLAAADASAIVLPDGDSLHLVARADVELEAHLSVDETRRLYSVRWTPTPATLLTDDPLVVAKARDRASVAAAAQCVGIAQRLLDFTVEYVQERHQFGKPVGVNQAIKHHLADVGKAIEFARPMVYRAAWALSTSSPDQGSASSMAKLLASDAVDLACRSSLQCHGAIAYTVEYDLQLWLKRGWALAAAWGDAAHHRNRIGASLGI